MMVGFNCRSTNLDSWNQDQLKLMSIGGNARAGTFFKQHGWTEGGKIESKYTSNAAVLYRQILAKDAAKSTLETSSPVPGSPTGFNFKDIPIGKNPNADSVVDSGDSDYLLVDVPKTAAIPTTQHSARKPTSIGVKKTGAKLGGSLGVKKLTAKVNMLTRPFIIILIFFILPFF
jgi:ADP-ribosylation factor GTPase-activating protein 2/3